MFRDASSPSFAETATAGEPSFEQVGAAGESSTTNSGAAGGSSIASSGAASETSFANSCAADRACSADSAPDVRAAFDPAGADLSAVALVKFRSEVGIRFDSVESALEAAVLRHVTQLAAAPVTLDRPGGVVHSDRELRIVAPVSGDERVDEAAAVAIEFGVLRGLLDLTAPAGAGASWLRGGSGDAPGGTGRNSGSSDRRKKWWPFAVFLLAGGIGIFGGNFSAAGVRGGEGGSRIDGLRGAKPTRAVGRPLRGETIGAGAESYRLKPAPLGVVATVAESHRLKPALLEVAAGVTETHRLKPVLLELVGGVAESYRLKPALLLGAGEMQGQFATGQGAYLDPCKAQAKKFASINLTGNTQLVSGTASEKIYLCSIHVVTAAAADIAVVEGTGTVCGTGTAGVSGFGGATAATGWNFAANGGIALGNGDASLGAEVNSGDNLCIFSSGSGQVSGGISYVVE